MEGVSSRPPTPSGESAAAGDAPSGTWIPRSDPPRLLDGAVVFLACIVPPALTLLLFSLEGYGLTVYRFVAPLEMAKWGNLCAFLTAAWLCGFFIFDWHLCHPFLQAIIGMSLAALAIVAAWLKGIQYPWAPILFTLALTPAMLLELRRGVCFFMQRTSFYRMVRDVTFITAVLLVVTWVPWVFRSDYTSSGAQWSAATKTQLIQDSGNIYAQVLADRPLNHSIDCLDADLTQKDPAVARTVSSACTQVATVWFTLWAAPFIAILFNLLMSAFCLLQARLDLNDEKQLVSFLQQFVCLVVFLLMSIYGSFYVSGASLHLSSALMTVFLGSMLTLIVYTYHEVRPAVLRRLAETSSFAKYLVKAYNSDWVRAIGIGSLNLTIPIFLCLDMLRQLARRCRGSATSTGYLTQIGQQIWNELSHWDWISVFSKINVLGELFVAMDVGSKFTFIFLSWLNFLLIKLHLGIICLIVFIVGVLMSLLPPVPGAALFLFGGVVIGGAAQSTIGFWPGVAVASLVSFVAKLVGSVMQYYIGYLLAQSVQVQKFIGVDTVPTRAIEQILKEPGMKMGKIAILVGGPDWPTSVTTGILHMNIPQMLLGTCPVFFVGIAPQVLVGALLTLENQDNAQLWNALKVGATAIAAVVQGLTILLAAHVITKTIERDGEMLAQHRPEHDAVAALTKKEEAFTQALKQISLNPGFCRLSIIGIAAVLQLLVGCVFAADFILFEPICLRKFEITGDIWSPIEDGGLAGNPLNIIRVPIGVANLLVFSIAVMMHIYHGQDMSRAAKQLVHADIVTPG